MILLAQRKILADSLRAALAAAHPLAGVQDFLALLAQWESGTLHGLPHDTLPLDASRPQSRYPLS